MMNNKNPKPKGPENWSICSCCGYSAAKSKYKHKCYNKAIIFMALLMIPTIPLLALVIKILTSAA